MKSKLILSVCAFLMVLISGCTDRYEGDDILVTINRDLPDFTKVNASHTMEVNITQGSTQSVEIVVNQNLQSQIRTEVKDNTLHLSLASGSYKNVTFIVNIQVPDFESLKLKGSTRGKVNFETDQMELIVAGSSEMEAEGSCALLTTKLEGSGAIKAFLLEADVVNTSSKGSTVLETNCIEKLNGSVRHSSVVYYRGTPVINATISHSAQIINDN